MKYIVHGQGQTNNKTIHQIKKHIEVLFNLVFMEIIVTLAG